MHWLPHSALVAKVLWLPPITAHCFRPQWATPDQPVLWRANAVQSAMSNVHSAIWDVIYKVKSALRSDAPTQCKVITYTENAVHGRVESAEGQWIAMYCGALACTAHTLVALSDDRRGFNWSMASFVTDPEPTTRFPTAFSLKSLWLHQKSKYVTTKPLKPKLLI